MSLVKSININNLKIARDNMGLDSVTATKKISASKKNLVAEWESGKSLPNWSQVEKLARVYNISELLFFSPKTIQKNNAIPDYRVGADEESSENVKKLINLVMSRQKWLERFLQSEGFSKNRLLGSGKNHNTSKRLAEFIKEKLEIDLEEIKKFSSREVVLNYLIEKAEKKGVFVGKTISYHRLKVEDMRGLFISNDYCPFIIINRRDAFAAQIFSFVHELAHFFRKSDAVSNSLNFRNAIRKVNPEEIFCNQVAAEFLLPSQELKKAFYDKSDINRISERFKVSPLVVFYRLKELEKIQKEGVNALETEIEKETKENLRAKDEKKRTTGGNHTNNMKSSNGSLFNRIVSKSYLENKIGYVEASNLLRFSPERV